VVSLEAPDDLLDRQSLVLDRLRHLPNDPGQRRQTAIRPMIFPEIDNAVHAEK
jgi:hypothetical protein